MKRLFTLTLLLCGTCSFAQTPDICMVTVDEGTNFNMIAWDKVAFPAASYNIYQETSPGTFTSIGNVATGSLSVFFDINSDPDASSSSYRITTIDGGSNESAQSATHSTMFLSASIGGSGEVNMNWTPYVGFTTANYNIWRGATVSTMTQIGNVSGVLNSYIDANPGVGTWCYKVEATNPAGCTASAPSTDYSAGYSNAVCATVNSIEGVNGPTLQVVVAPNPFKQSATISVDSKEIGLELDLYNMIGKRVQGLKFSNGSVQVQRENLPNGIYLYRISSEGKLLFTDKLVIQ